MKCSAGVASAINQVASQQFDEYDAGLAAATPGVAGQGWFDEYTDLTILRERYSAETSEYQTLKLAVERINALQFEFRRLGNESDSLRYENDSLQRELTGLRLRIAHAVFDLTAEERVS